MESRSLVRLIALSAAAVASGVLLSRLDDDAPPAPPGPQLSGGYYVTDAELIGTGDDGRVLYRVQTDRATEQGEDGSVRLQRVRIIYSEAAAVPWDLRADAGLIPAGGKMLELTGDVEAVTRQGSGEAATIRTEYLRLEPENFVAFTDRKVSIDYSGSRLFAVGMRAFLKEDRLELISNVNGKFIP